MQKFTWVKLANVRAKRCSADSLSAVSPAADHRPGSRQPAILWGTFAMPTAFPTKNHLTQLLFSIVCKRALKPAPQTRRSAPRCVPVPGHSNAYRQNNITNPKTPLLKQPASHTKVVATQWLKHQIPSLPSVSVAKSKPKPPKSERIKPNQTFEWVGGAIFFTAWPS